MGFHEFISQVEEYADRAGVTPEHVCRQATNNPRLWERMKRRFEQAQADVNRISQFMRDHPPSEQPREPES